MDAREQHVRNTMDCDSKYTITEGEALKCEQHLGGPGAERHSARSMGIRWYWTDEEADR